MLPTPFIAITCCNTVESRGSSNEALIVRVEREPLDRFRLRIISKFFKVLVRLIETRLLTKGMVDLTVDTTLKKGP